MGDLPPSALVFLESQSIALSEEPNVSSALMRMRSNSDFFTDAIEGILVGRYGLCSYDVIATLAFQGMAAMKSRDEKGAKATRKGIREASPRASTVARLVGSLAASGKSAYHSIADLERPQNIS
jgi:hypothetical protein